jgi:hypothetical protein
MSIITFVYERLLAEGVFVSVVREQAQRHLDGVRTLPDDDQDKQAAIAELEGFIANLPPDEDQ